MNTENLVKHLRVLWRTDKIIADIRMRHLLAGLGLRAFAALIAAFAGAYWPGRVAALSSSIWPWHKLLRWAPPWPSLPEWIRTGKEHTG